MFYYSLSENRPKTSTWWRSGDETTADKNLEAYFNSLKRSTCEVCGVRVTTKCSDCGGKFCSEHLANHSCGQLLPLDPSPHKVQNAGS